jgi:hypothetical protein
MIFQVFGHVKIGSNHALEAFRDNQFGRPSESHVPGTAFHMNLLSNRQIISPPFKGLR